jgi:hypothetical protein
MVKHNPMGVGLGDWQTHYPIHRRHDPSRYFQPEIQVRRAHSDHVQVLGEAGWPGLALWVAVLVVLIWTTSRRFLAGGGREPLFLAAQLVAFAAAMTTDYVTEIPYHRALFFLVVFLAVKCNRSEAPVRSPDGIRIFTAAAIATTVVALGQVVYHASLARKVHAAAHLEQSYAAALRTPSSPADGVNPAAFARPYELGTRFASMFGHTKTFHKNWLILAHCSLLTHRRDVAIAAAGRALDLHPNSPAAHLLMSRLEDDPEAARKWLSSHELLIRGSNPEGGD